MMAKQAMKTANYRICHPAGVWTLFVEKEQTSTTDRGLIGRGITIFMSLGLIFNIDYY